MPVGPKGETRPADVIANAILASKIANGEAQQDSRVSGRRQSGLKGGKSRAAKLTEEQRREVAKHAAALWKPEALPIR